MQIIRKSNCALLVLACPAIAQQPFNKGWTPLVGASQSMQILLLLTALTLLPAVIMTVTPFLRITVVLHFLRQALGTQSTPSNQVLLGIGLFLTAMIMQPVFAQAYKHGWEPFERGELTAA